jgi:SAM-dependent methyltransferase
MQDTERVVASVTDHLPASLVPFFDGRFTRSHILFDEFVHRLATQVCQEAGLFPAIHEWISVEEIVARTGLDRSRSMVPVDWMFRHFAARGRLVKTDGPAPRFRSQHVFTALDPAPLRGEQRRHDPGCLPSYTLAETAALDYPAFLRGERSGEDILLAPKRLSLWTDYFSNANLLYAVNNRVGAVALETWMPPEPHTVLEVGGGLASGAVAALEHLAAVGRLDRVRAYHFTELVPAFLRRGARHLRERFDHMVSLRVMPLDMNQSFAEQAVEPESVSVVYAVNTLHVAHDLAYTLGQIRHALEPGGRLIVSECIRPFAGSTIYPEFVFNLLETFRAPRLHPTYRPTGGFLTPEQWTDALAAAGFVDVRILPDIARIRDVFPTFYVAAVGATRSD